jgi:hypothetical protein
MEDFVPFASRMYLALLAVLFFARSMDFLSTWIATPNLVLEGNPVARKLGWKWGIPLNVALCLGFAVWPLPAVVISTTSLLVAARNLQGAWLMRSMGEQSYRQWHVERVQDANITLILGCLFGQTALIALIGAVVVALTDWQRQPVLMGIGLGIIAYAGAVGFYSMLGIWKLRQADLRTAREARRASIAALRDSPDQQPLSDIYPSEGARPGS